jgi:hypothetical protein
MRLLGTVALIGGFLSIGNIRAQNGSDRGGTADNARRTGSGKATAPAPRKAEKWYGTSRTDALTESAPEGRRSTSELLRAASEKEEPEPAEPPASSTAANPSSVPSVPSMPLVAPAPPVEFATREATADEVGKIKIGASEKEVLTALGMPTSRIVVPDDDGHLRKTYQYWAKGSPVGTVRLDNGYVVKVEVRRR